MSEKSLFNLDKNISGALCYALHFFTGIFYLIMEKDNKFVRFHALQSTVWFGACWILRTVLGMIPILGGILSWLLSLIMFVSWLYLMFMAYKNEMFRIPVIGDVVYEQINK